MKQFKHRLWVILERQDSTSLGRSVDIFILSMIFLNVLAVILISVERIEQEYGTVLHYFELFSVGVFSIEYIARLSVCTLNHAFQHPFYGRLRYAARPLLIVDLLAILPFYLSFMGVFSTNLIYLRLFRLLRILRIAKFFRYYNALKLLFTVVHSRREELILTSIIMLLILVVSSCLVYFFEHSAQPEDFPDIPSTMWWGIVTLTTVGYGDLFPVTVGGKIVTSVVAVLGIGMFALPAGIIGSGFIEEINKQKQPPAPLYCPHCGKPLLNSEIKDKASNVQSNEFDD